MLARFFPQASEYGDQKPSVARHIARDSIFPIAAFAFVLAALIAPKFIHTLLPAAFVCFFMLHYQHITRSSTRRTRSEMGTTSIYFVLAALFLFSRAIAAPDPTSALRLLIFCAALLAMTWQMNSACARFDTAHLRELAQGVLFATLVGAIYLVIELLTSQSVVTFALDHIPLLAGGRQSHFVIADGKIESVRTYVLDRNIGVLNLVLWPVLLIAVNEARRLKELESKLCVYFLFFMVFVATFLSVHKTSKIALVFASAIFVLTKLSKRAALLSVSAIWLLATLAVVPAARFAYDNGLQNCTLLAGSARARIVIWNFEAKQIPDAWFLGRGINSVLFYDELQSPNATVVPGELAKQHNGRHSHNVYLQIWYELGAVGALFFSIAGLLILRQMASMRARAFPFAIATFASAMTIMAFSWGLWQHWYFGAVCIAAALLGLATEQERRRQADVAEARGGASEYLRKPAALFIRTARSSGYYPENGR